MLSAALVCPIHLEIPSFGTIPEMCSRRLNLKAKMTRTCPGRPKGSFGTLGCPLLGGTPASIHSFRELFTSFPRVSIRFVCYLHYSRWYPFILYSISPFPRVSIDFVRYLHNSRGYPFILYVIYIIPAGIHIFCPLFPSFPRPVAHPGAFDRQRSRAPGLRRRRRRIEHADTASTPLHPALPGNGQ